MPRVLSTVKAGLFCHYDCQDENHAGLTDEIQGYDIAFQADHATGLVLPSYVAGRNGRKAIHFDGLDGQWAYTNHFNPRTNPNFPGMTKCCWVRSSMTSIGGLMAGLHSTIYYSNLMFCLNSNNRVYWGFGPASWAYDHNTANDVWVDNTWFHVCATYSQQWNRIRLYIDGVLLQEFPTDNKLQWSKWEPMVGCRYQDGTQVLNGDMDDIRIYQRELRLHEVEELANA